MAARTTSNVFEILRFFGSVSIPNILELDKAYRSYRAYKTLTPEQLDDMGIDPSTLGLERFSDFLERNYR